eukprot:scaffold235289_cov19-Tisochrysis_lutea.AAC.1
MAQCAANLNTEACLSLRPSPTGCACLSTLPLPLARAEKFPFLQAHRPWAQISKYTSGHDFSQTKKEVSVVEGSLGSLQIRLKSAQTPAQGRGTQAGKASIKRRLLVKNTTITCSSPQVFGVLSLEVDCALKIAY